MKVLTEKEIKEKMESDFVRWACEKLTSDVKEISECELEMYRKCFHAGCACGSSFFNDLVL